MSSKAKTDESAAKAAELPATLRLAQLIAEPLGLANILKLEREIADTQDKEYSTEAHDDTGQSYNIVSLRQWLDIMETGDLHDVGFQNALLKMCSECGVINKIPISTGIFDKIDVISKVFPLLLLAVSPLIPTDDELKDMLVKTGFAEEQAIPLIDSLKSHVRFMMISHGKTAQQSVAWALFEGASKFAFDIFRKTTSTEFNTASSKDDGELISAWEIARRKILPERAVSYSEGKLPGETVLDYFRRFWGPYQEAGILYQDDIERLGDSNLIKTVRTRCRRLNLDANAILPPLGFQRDKDELAQTPIGSRDFILLDKRIQERERATRTRQSRRAPV